MNKMYGVCYDRDKIDAICIMQLENCENCIKTLGKTVKCEKDLTDEEQWFLNVLNNRNLEIEQEFIFLKSNLSDRQYSELKLIVCEQYKKAGRRLAHLAFKLDKFGYKTVEKFKRAEKEFYDLEAIYNSYEKKITTLISELGFESRSLETIKDALRYN